MTQTTSQKLTNHEKPSVKVIMAAVAGNTLEFYDFIIYSFFAVYIGKTFFPTDNEIASLLASLAVFGVGFFTRPLGGFLIGTFADKAGRKAAMIMTVTLITIGTLGLAATPSYEQIGIAAPIIVLIARLIQGLGLGGEVGPVSAMLVEMAPANKRGLYASWQMASQGIAVFLGGIIAYSVFDHLTVEQITAWGWRIPFLFSLFIIPLAIYIRKTLPETLEDRSELSSTALVNILLSDYTKYFILGILIMIASAVSVQVSNYMTTYALTILKLSPQQSQIATVFNGTILFAFSLLAGYLSDKYNRKILIILPRLLLTLLIVPLFYWLNVGCNIYVMIIVTCLVTMLSAMSGAICLVAIPEMMPKNIRSTGVSLVYAISVTVFGGTAQFIITWLIGKLGPIAPAYYVVLTGIISLIAMYMMPETKHLDVKK